MSSDQVAARRVSAGDKASQDIGPTKPHLKGKGKTVTTASNSRRKEEDISAKSLPSKEEKGNTGAVIGAGTEESDGVDEECGEGGNAKTKMTDEEHRQNFLQRNRIAARKCRQRKKQWLANLHNNVEMHGSENDALTARITQRRLEVLNLKTLLLAHKGCPVAQQQGLHGAFMSQVVEPFNAQMNPFGMVEPMSSISQLWLNGHAKEDSSVATGEDVDL